MHLAALHPLIAPPDANDETYRAANVVPFAALLDAARAQQVRRVVLASSTSVWRDSPPGTAARFLDETSEADGDDGYARSKRECEALARAAPLETVVLRLARFARRGDPEDDVRLLYRAIDPDDAATAVVAALDRAAPGALYAISAPTPFRREDAASLRTDPRAVITQRTGREPVWAPAAIGSVIVATRAVRDLGWRATFPSSLYPRPT